MKRSTLQKLNFQQNFEMLSTPEVVGVTNLFTSSLILFTAVIFARLQYARVFASHLEWSVTEGASLQ
jgi:hypothetical protein